MLVAPPPLLSCHMVLVARVQLAVRRAFLIIRRVLVSPITIELFRFLDAALPIFNCVQ